jgi:Kef-type K+ transport system membrane component KefB
MGDVFHHLLPDIGLAIIMATVLGLVAHWLRQPIILGYLVAGALVGPQVGFGLIHGSESIEIISEIGLVLLLFIIGLEMNVNAILKAGKALLVAGFGQFLVCAAVGVGFFALFGYGLRGTHADGLYLALMCGLSSTAIVVKLLYDKNELDTLPGRVTLAVLVIQDIYAIFILAFQPNFASPSLGPILKALGGTALLLAMGFLLSRILLGRIFASIARQPEMVVAVSVGWCAAVAGAAGALGLSREMGALVAGLSIAAFPYSVHVTAKTLPLRDFFLTLFFMSLGMKITPLHWNMVGIVVTIVAFVIATRFVSVYPLLAFSGAGRRTAFISSLNLAQISEFSLVIASLGVVYGHIGERTVAITIYAMAITAVLSSYGIRYNHQLFQWFDGLMARIGRGASTDEDEHAGAGHASRPVALLGFHRVARAMIDSLAERSPHLLKRVLVIDFNPEVLAELKARGIAAVFGDISSLDTLEHHHLKEAQLIFCTIPDFLLKGTDNLTLTRSCRVIAPEATIIATADDSTHEQKLQEAGAGFVVKPYELSGGRLARYVREWSAFGGAIEMGAAAILGPTPTEAVQAACECQQVRKAA